MNKLALKKEHKQLRKNRIKSVIRGTETRPRLTVSISLTHVSAQIIDDVNSVTLAYSTTIGVKKEIGNLMAKAQFVGTDIGKKAVKKGIKSVVFDRNGKLYHGRVKALADNARSEGLEF